VKYTFKSILVIRIRFNIPALFNNVKSLSQGSNRAGGSYRLSNCRIPRLNKAAAGIMGAER
jgi:hypothetical protein